MATLGSLIISLEANVAKFESSMNRAEYLAKKSSDTIVSSLKVVGATLGAMFSVSAMDKAFNSFADMGSQLVKTASRLNTSAETLSSFGVLARKTGMDSEAFITTLTRMDKGLSAAAQGAETATGKFDENGEEILKTSKTYDELGLKAEELIKLPLDQRLLAIAEAFQKNIAPGDRVRVAMELGGKSAAGMVNAFKDGPEAMQKMIDRQKELGVWTDDMAKRASDAKSAASDMTSAWSAFGRELMDSVAPAITWVISRLTDLIVASRKAPTAMQTAAEGAFSEINERMGKGPGGVTGSWVPQEVFKPAVKPSEKGGGGGKGGGGTDAEATRLANLYSSLMADIAKLSEGSLSEIEANLQKTIDSIYKKIETRVTTEAELEVLARKRASLQKQKAEEDYSLFVAKESGDMYVQIEAEAKAWLEKYKGFAGAEEQIAAIKARRVWEEDVKNQEKRLSMQKGVFDAIAQETPLLSQQLEWKQKILPIELQLNNLALERMIAENKIGQAQADELRGLQALANQAKKYSLEREQWKAHGVAGGLRMGAQDMRIANETALAEGVANWVKNAPQQISEQMASSFVGFLQGKAPDLQQLGITMAESMIQKLLEGMLTQIIPTLAEGLASSLSGIGGGGGGIGGLLGDIPVVGGLVESIGGLFGFHQGGLITAHGGWPSLAPDERLIKAQTGERVLSREQNKAYEAGIGGSGGGGTPIVINVTHSPAYHYRPTEADYKRDARAIVKAINEQIGNRGQKVGDGRF